MPWHPSQKPRAPRVRAEIRNVNRLPNLIVPFPPSNLSKEDLDRIIDKLPFENEPAIIEAIIIHIEHQYRFDRLAPEPARAVTRHQLRSLIHHCWHISENAEAQSCHLAELSKSMRALDPRTKELLFGAIWLLYGDAIAPEYRLYKPTGMDIELIYLAASTADYMFSGRGDYKDWALVLTVASLLAIWIKLGGDVTVAKVERPLAQKDALRKVATSACAMFIFEFFAVVDSGLSQATITAHLEKVVRSARTGIAVS